MKKKLDPLLQGANHGHKTHAAGLSGERFFFYTFKMADEDSHSADSRVSSEEDYFYKININIDAKSLLMHRWFRRKIEQKCLEILLLSYFGYFGIGPSKGIEEQNFPFF